MTAPLKQAKSFNKYETYNILRDYNWIVKEANRIKLQLNKFETVGVASYSDEPRGGNGTSDRISGEVIRREKNYKRLNGYLDKIAFIEERLDNIVDEKEKVVLDCILDGMGINAIAVHLNMSRRMVHKLRDNIVDELVEGLRG